MTTPADFLGFVPTACHRLICSACVGAVLFATPAYGGVVDTLVSAGKSAGRSVPDSAWSAGDGFNDARTGQNNSARAALSEAGSAAATLGVATVSASTAGAGSLAGYAGTASAVSSMGLGGVTTTVAGAMGSSATGAAATSVVTAAVGGPLVMGGILVVGAAAAGYGCYKAGQWAWKAVR